MFGRYGADALNNAMLVLCLVLMILSRVLRAGWLDLLSIAVLVICYLRVFSRNINARYQENQKFLAAVQPVRKWFGGMKQRFRDRKTHRYFTCPSCGMTLQKRKIEKKKWK